MSSSKENNLLEQKEEYEKVAQDSFNSILAAYRLVINEISDDSFNEVNEILGKGMNKTVERVGSAFKEHLFGLIKESFTKIWKDRDMDNNIAILEIAKKHFTVEQEWRPANKTVDEQLQPHLGKILLKERDFLRKQIEDQKEMIAKCIPILEENRRRMKQRLQKRSEIMAEISKDLSKIEENSTQVDKIFDQVSALKED